ncbi:hypothetical protein GGI03_004350 [Coemansia sp. RSA 2337]|nr:hypothetical protein H4S03_005345 [Coemansia sp. S3946]KAJ2042644.1 hypothetical protein H4S04_007189 [Coemansia sp. S16]KAJ2063522.1 hypothetical protein GGI08_002511 [Coemansia sp. S2]KAJ2106825.1 hypothetical protein IW146_007605 [Coemansia sp. RSA 922]KAJ2462630.1 hypothetical protein GGI03_004350 [Coemansia sp. RSA 2337]
MNLDNTPCTRPPEDWGLDPLFWVSAKLFIGDLHLAIPSDLTSVYFIGNQHIVRSVEIVGVVVSVSTRSLKLTEYLVDDGTGIILCAEFTTPEEQSDPETRYSHPLGETVLIEGRLSDFRNERQVIIRSIKSIDPNQETLGWLERLALRDNLASPYI